MTARQKRRKRQKERKAKRTEKRRRKNRGTGAEGNPLAAKAGADADARVRDGAEAKEWRAAAEQESTRWEVESEDEEGESESEGSEGGEEGGVQEAEVDDAHVQSGGREDPGFRTPADACPEQSSEAREAGADASSGAGARSAPPRRKLWVAVQRSEAVQAQREGLPVVLMEAEIMEAVQEHPAVIVCGETGSGKTTQVPQFLYEAGYGSTLPGGVRGAIGMTQPRRVAVLATARRLAEELNVKLGQEVGFQVRHDVRVGEASAIKVMTDGILLREVQSDFLLRTYSVLIVDEAHERSVNTDILLGLLSRIIPLRQRLYEEHIEKESAQGRDSSTWASEHVFCPSAPVLPLKLIIMSATLRVQDFTANQRLFPTPPPVVSVPARQFPVTIHFSRKTEIADYVRAAEKKVAAIHRRLPPGGVLVFLTGQREVEELCSRLKRKFGRARCVEHAQGRLHSAKAVQGKSSQLSGTQERGNFDSMHAAQGQATANGEDATGYQERMEEGGPEDEGAAFDLALLTQGSDPSKVSGTSGLGWMDMEEEEEPGLEGKEGHSAEQKGGEGGNWGDQGSEGHMEEGHSSEDNYEESEDEDSEEDWETWGVLEGEGPSATEEGATATGKGAVTVNGQARVHPWAGLPSLSEIAEQAGILAQGGTPSGSAGASAAVTPGNGEHHMHSAVVPGQESADAQQQEQQQQQQQRMHVLPLYAMLPAAAQLKVFRKVPQDSRLVVVATNVAETSITIPGIRYVVDAGRVKVKSTSRASGMATFSVQWVSQASANQRAGRAGRTGPGHCYRLYSSALFADTFAPFSPPEIDRCLIDGVVLQMKALGIDKVVNFPFPSLPDPTALRSAETVLSALSALAPRTLAITSLGRAMAALPVGPRHARMLLEVLSALLSLAEDPGQGDRRDRATGGGRQGSPRGALRPVLLSFVCAVAAALSVESPFVHGDSPTYQPNANGSRGTDESTGRKKGADGGFTVAHGPEQRDSKQSRKFLHKDSDAFAVALALRQYEQEAFQGRQAQAGAAGPTQREQQVLRSARMATFCRQHGLQEQRMREACLLRLQLLRLLLACSPALRPVLFGCGQSEEGGGNWVRERVRALVVQGEAQWSNPNEVLTDAEETELLKGLCAGWVDRVARKLAPGEHLGGANAEQGNASGLQPKKPKHSSRYETQALDCEVLLHPRSVLKKAAPAMLVYSEITVLPEKPDRPYLTGVSRIMKSWLYAASPSLCALSKPLSDPPPFYSRAKDCVQCWVIPSFGPKAWELPPVQVAMAPGKSRCAVFANSLLTGKVVDVLNLDAGALAASPALLLRSEGLHQKRVLDLVARLYGDGMAVTVVDSLAALCSRWQQQRAFLLPEIMAWVRKEVQAQLESRWTDILAAGFRQHQKLQKRKQVM